MKDGETRLTRWLQLAAAILWLVFAGGCTVFYFGFLGGWQSGWSILVPIGVYLLIALIVAVPAVRDLMGK